MFQRFSDDAKSAFNNARIHAQRSFADALGTEHLLLGILDVEGSSATALLDSLELDKSRLRSAIENEMPAGMPRAPWPALSFTSALKKALELAMREAEGLGSRELGLEHLLLGLAIEPEGAASRALLRSGFSIERARSFVNPHADTSRPAHGGDHRSDAWRLRVLEDAAAALDEIGETPLAENVREVARRHGSRK